MFAVLAYMLLTFVETQELSELESTLSKLESSLADLTLKLQQEEDILQKVISVLDKVDSVRSTFVLQQKPANSKPNVTSTEGPRKNYQVANLSEGEFETVPKYLRGRLTLDRVNSWIDQFTAVVQEKYASFNGNPAKMAGEIRNRYYDWREQESEECRGCPFVTEQDMKTLVNGKGPKMDPTGRSIMAILRHCGRVREVRTTGIVRFVLC